MNPRDILARVALKSANANDGRGIRGARDQGIRALIDGGTNPLLATKCVLAAVQVGLVIAHVAARGTE